VFIHEAGSMILGVSVLKNMSVLFYTHTHIWMSLAFWLVAQISHNSTGNVLAPVTDVPVLKDCCQ
jgi:hypothetical protein